MYPIAVVYVYVAALSILGTLAHAFAAKALGVQVEEVKLSKGPTIARFRSGGTAWIVNLVPGPWNQVKIRAKGGDDFGKGLDDLHTLHRILVPAAGSLSLVAVAFACLGPTAGARSVLHGFRDLVLGAVSPEATGVPLVRSLFRIIETGPARTGLGIVAAKMAAFGLLPLLPSDGGQIVWGLAQWRTRFPDRLMFRVACVSLTASLLIACCWLFAIARVVLGG